MLNYKSQQQALVMNNKETPKFRNNTNTNKHQSTNNNPLMDTKSLLSDHIKKHVKTARNTSPNSLGRTKTSNDGER